MKRLDVPFRRVIAGTALATGLAFAGLTPVSAEDATTSGTTATSESTTTSTARRRPRATATPEMIAEAIERSQARTRRFLSEGVPEQFGSEGASFTSSSSTAQ